MLCNIVPLRGVHIIHAEQAKPQFYACSVNMGENLINDTERLFAFDQKRMRTHPRLVPPACFTWSFLEVGISCSPGLLIEDTVPCPTFCCSFQSPEPSIWKQRRLNGLTVWRDGWMNPFQKEEFLALISYTVTNGEESEEEEDEGPATLMLWSFSG